MDGSTVTPAAARSARREADAIRIVLADDHAVVRSALRMLLDAEPGLEVVAEAGDVDGAVRYVRGHRPDVLILDLNMPGRPSLDALPEISHASPETQVVVLTMQSEPAFAREAMQAGVLRLHPQGGGRRRARQGGAARRRRPDVPAAGPGRPARGRAGRRRPTT